MARRDEGFFSSRDGTRLFFRSAAPELEPKALVAIVHGMGEHSGRYLHTMDGLVAQGFSTIAVDYRGHGKADGPRTDCRVWSDYLDDLDAFWRKAVAQAAGKPTFVLAHSHGGLIATHWAALHPVGLAGLVLSAPYFALAFDPPPLKMLGARLIKGLMPGLPVATGLTPQQLSRDPAWQQATAADPLYLRTITPRCFFGLQEAQRRLSPLASSVTVPVLMAAGSADPVASTKAARTFFDFVASKDKAWKEYPDFLHEILNEVGRERVLGDIAQWISSHC
jgi:alpha-beta hydrolase superfamily lysophospholipase